MNNISQKRPELIIMIGIPGSGKSAYADCRRSDYTVISTDEIRQELCGDYSDQRQNKIVFELFHLRIANALKDGENVIADATSLTIKHRRNIFKCIKGINCKVTGVVMVSPLEVCIRNEEKREKPVGENIIKRGILRFQMPNRNEGFETLIYHFNDINFKGEKELQALVDKFKIDSRYRGYKLDTHCYSTKILTSAVSDCQSLLYAAGIHDIGKVFTEHIDENGEAHYYGHANYGAYYILSECHGLNFPESITDVAFYVNYHMLPFDWKHESTRNRYMKIFGEQRYKNLLHLHRCDKFARSAESLSKPAARELLYRAFNKTERGVMTSLHIK